MELKLLHLGSLFTKSTQEAKNEETVVRQAPGRLPSELLCLIMSFVKDPKDLISLCKSSHALYDVSQPILYKFINIRVEPGVVQVAETMFLYETALMKLFQTLQSRGFTRIVTEFRIKFIKCDRYNPKKGFLDRMWRTCSCDRYNPKKGFLDRMWRTCSCDRFHPGLGQTLLSLERLNVLEITCHCCRESQPTLHRYLQSLRTQNLQNVTLSCNCIPRNTDHTLQILTAPCMSHLTSLSLLTTYRQTECAGLSSKESLPHLKNLRCYFVAPILVSLLAKGTVTALVCELAYSDNDFDQLHQIVRQYPGVLSHLSLLNVESTLPKFIISDPSPYLNLRHFGKIGFSLRQLSSSVIQDSLSSLSLFPKLSSVQIWLFLGDGPLYNNEFSKFLLDPDTTDYMRHHVPCLKKIYLVIMPPRTRSGLGREWWIWEQRSNEWEGEKVSEFDAWDLAIGRA